MIAAVLEPDIHPHALGRERRFDAILAQLAGDIGMQSAQGGGSPGGAKLIEGFELLLRDAAVRENIVRDACPKSSYAPRVAGSTRHQQSIGDAPEVQILLIGTEKCRVEILAIGIIVPRVREFARGAEHGAIVGMLEIGIARAALDVAAADV